MSDFIPFGSHTADTTDVCPIACRRLWAAVFAGLWRASFGIKVPGYSQPKARAWFETRDFTIVCNLIGLDPRAVFDRWKAFQSEFESTGKVPDMARFYAKGGV